LVGFLISAGALLYAVANTRLIQQLQKSGHFHKVLVDLFIAVVTFFLALGFSITALIPISWGAESAWPSTLISIATHLNIISFLLLIPVGWSFWILLTNLDPTEPAEAAATHDWDEPVVEPRTEAALKQRSRAGKSQQKR